MHQAFGSAQGNKHTPPDLSYDIDRLMDSMREYKIYTLDPQGRVIEGDKAVVADVLAVGAQQLVGPLRDYNSLFERLRRRRRLHPVTGEALAVFSHAVAETTGNAVRTPALRSVSPDLSTGTLSYKLNVVLL